MTEELPLSIWDLPEPHTIAYEVASQDTDAYGHVNNSVYLKWMDQCVWDHCDAVNLSAAKCVQLNRGFAVVRHEIDYLRSAYAGDRVLVANWVVANDERLRAERAFQIVRVQDRQTLVRAKTWYICTDLQKGVPRRMPQEFKSGFGVSPRIAMALEANPAT